MGRGAQKKRKERNLRRRSLRSGFSLVELMVSTLLFTIIFIGWLTISNFQAIRRESLRRLAIETASGYLDVMAKVTGPSIGFYTLNPTNLVVSSTSPPPTVEPLFGSSEPIGYTLEVVQTSSLPPDIQHEGWPDTHWAVIRLYDRHSVPTNEAGRAFNTMSIFMR